MVTGKIMEVWRSCSNSFMVRTSSLNTRIHGYWWNTTSQTPSETLPNTKMEGLNLTSNDGISQQWWCKVWLYSHDILYVNLHLLASCCYLFAKELFRAWDVRLICKYISWAAEEKTHVFSMISVTTPWCVPCGRCQEFRVRLCHSAIQLRSKNLNRDCKDGMSIPHKGFHLFFWESPSIICTWWVYLFRQPDADHEFWTRFWDEHPKLKCVPSPQ